LQNSHDTAPIAEAHGPGVLLWPAAKEHKVEKPEPASAEATFCYTQGDYWQPKMPKKASTCKAPKAFKGGCGNSTPKSCTDYSVVGFSLPTREGIVHYISAIDGYLGANELKFAQPKTPKSDKFMWIFTSYR
jgi:hypothetical protein